MTLIIGIRCHDGVVIGADGAVTLGEGGESTAQQVGAQKLFILDGRAIFATAGHIGLGQQLCAAAEKSVREAPAGETPAAAQERVSRELWRVQGEAIKRAHHAQETLGRSAVVSSCHAMSMLAFPIDGTSELMQFDLTSTATRANASIPWFALGSGQSIADPFLAFVRRMTWRSSLPSVAEAIFAVTWTLHHAVQTGIGGVGMPITVAQLARRDATWEARLLSREEMTVHDEAVFGVEAGFQQWRDDLGKRPDADATTRPPE